MSAVSSLLGQRHPRHQRHFVGDGRAGALHHARQRYDMGLTIHYQLATTGDEVHARKLVQQLRQAALDLPFQHVGEIVELRGDQCDWKQRPDDDPYRWLLIQAGTHIALPVSPSEKHQGASCTVTQAKAVLSEFMKKPVFRLGAICSLLMALLLSGCASIWSQPYPRLRDTDVHVSWMLTDYRNMVVAGRVTLGEREQVNAAYAQYKAAFDEALQAAHNNYDVPTPENVKALANEIIRILWAMPY